MRGLRLLQGAAAASRAQGSSPTAWTSGLRAVGHQLQGGASDFPAGAAAASAFLAAQQRNYGESVWDHVKSSFTSIKADVGSDGIAILTINRPEQLNALNTKVMQELVDAMMYLDRSDPHTKCIILTGTGDKAFAAGADIKEMSTVSFADAYKGSMLNGWNALRSVRKPIIAAVNGYALGGGCELAMLCDIILAADTASFGQPEVTLGVIPGMGGTQRLTHAVGKSRAMEMVLTGARISALEATKIGLISRAVPADQLLTEARKVASKIAEYSTPVISMAKECVNQAFELPLAEGLKFEKRMFWSCFALEDQKIGMTSFVKKEKPEWKHQ